MAGDLLPILQEGKGRPMAIPSGSEATAEVEAMAEVAATAVEAATEAAEASAGAAGVIAEEWLATARPAVDR